MILSYTAALRFMIYQPQSKPLNPAEMTLMHGCWQIMPKLNRDKTKLLVIGPKHKPALPINGIHVAGEYIEVSNYAKNHRGNIREMSESRELCY